MKSCLRRGRTGVSGWEHSGGRNCGGHCRMRLTCCGRCLRSSSGSRRRPRRSPCCQPSAATDIATAGRFSHRDKGIPHRDKRGVTRLDDLALRPERTRFERGCHEGQHARPQAREVLPPRPGDVNVNSYPVPVVISHIFSQWGSDLRTPSRPSHLLWWAARPTTAPPCHSSSPSGWPVGQPLPRYLCARPVGLAQPRCTCDWPVGQSQPPGLLV